MKIQVVFFIETNGYGGSEKHLIELIECLDPNEFEAKLILHTRTNISLKIEPFLEKINALVASKKLSEFIRFETHGVRREELMDIKSMHRLWRLLAKQQGIIHFYKNSIEACAKSVLMAWALRKKTIQTIQLGPGWHSKKLISRPEMRRALYLRLADKVITVSESIRQECIEYYKTPPEKIVTVHNGIRIGQFWTHKINPHDKRRELSKEIGIDLEGKIVFLAPARLEPIKGHEYLINGLKEVKANHNENYEKMVMLFAGTGTREHELKRMVNDAGVQEKVKFLGFRKDIPELLQASDAYILTSLNEGLPLAVVEAMAMKIPVLATSVDGTPEVVEDGKSGLLIRPTSSVDVAEKITRFMSFSLEKRKEMGMVGEKRAIDLFDHNKQTDKVKDIYRNLWKVII